MVAKKHLAKVRWHCRRGMLELDFMLQNFFDAYYNEMSKEGQQLFERLLECTDQELFMWLIGKSEPEDMELMKMVMRIKANFA